LIHFYKRVFTLVTTMDVTALLVFVSGFVVCAGAVFFFSIFGAKEETFEEALAKQRKANEKEKKSKDKKKENDNINKKSKNWRMKKKGERDDKQDGLEPVVIVSSPNVAHTSKQSSKIKKKRKAASSLLLHPDSFPASGDATSPNGIIIVDTADDTSADYVAVNHDEELLCDAQDDAEEEQLVVVPAGAKVEDVVEAAPEKVPEEIVPAVEVKPASKKEKKRTKIDIQEVEAVPEPKEVVDAAPAPAPAAATEEVTANVETEKVAVAETPENAPVVEIVKPTKSSPTKQKVKKEKIVPTESAPPNPKELLTIVKKTAFNDAEAQKLIDVLLTKQSGDSLNTSDEWIEKGKPTETQKLKQDLSEMMHYLEDERLKVKSFSDKLTAMRKELNDEKAAKANHNRIIDEIQKARGQEVSAINSRLQQVVAENSVLQGNLQNEAAVRRNLEMNQGHFQASIDNLNSQLEHAKVAANQAKANDPHLLTELEQLRTLRDKYENTLAEINVNNANLKNQISQQAEEISTVKAQLTSSSERVGQLANSNSSLEQALASKTEEAQKVSAELQKTSTELITLKSKPQEPIINNNNINIAAIEAELSGVKQQLAEKQQETGRLMEENERLSEQVASAVERPAAEGEEAAVVNGHAEVAAASSESDEWRDKFENLHMEHEKMLAKQKVLQSDFEAEVSNHKSEVETLKSKNNDLSSSLEKEKSAAADTLLRLFPSLSSKAEADLGQLEAEARSSLEALGRGEAQVAHYKEVLATTETMLTSLQSSVETAETEWKLKLEVANKELTDLKVEKSSLQTSHINTSQMQEQLSELQQKLAKEEEDKVTVSKLNDELRTTSQELDKEVERLSQQLSESQEKQGELSKEVAELKVTNTSLQGLVSTAQEALTKEQSLVKCLQEQAPSPAKGDVSISSESPPEEARSEAGASLGSASARSSVVSHRSSVQGRHLTGQFYGAKLSASAAGQGCPFPDDWTYATVPDSIANDEQVD